MERNDYGGRKIFLGIKIDVLCNRVRARICQWMALVYFTAAKSVIENITHTNIHHTFVGFFVFNKAMSMPKPWAWIFYTLRFPLKTVPYMCRWIRNVCLSVVVYIQHKSVFHAVCECECENERVQLGAIVVRTNAKYAKTQFVFISALVKCVCVCATVHRVLKSNMTVYNLHNYKKKVT